MQVEVNHQVYSSSSELGGIQIEDQPKDMDRPSFIRMDPPKHDDQRKVVSPVVAPGNLANMEGLIRERTITRARRIAARRDLRLGRAGVDRADDDDARDPVRLSVGRPPPADLLVGCRDRQCQLARRAGAFGGGALRRADQDGRSRSARCSTSGRSNRRNSTCCRCWRMARRRATCRSASSWARSRS